MYIGNLGDAALEASVGLGLAYFSFFFTSLCLACYEVTGIQCAKWFGEGNYYMMSMSLWHGFILSGAMLSFSVLSFWFCEDILLAINIAEINAELTGKMMRALIPGIIAQTINFQLMGFCTAQKIDKEFGISNL